MTTGYLVDKSALARWDNPRVAAVLDPALASGLLWSCPPVDLEVLYSCRSFSECALVRQERSRAYLHADLAIQVGAIALELQEALARSSRLRSAGSVDLLVAAVAAHHQLTVMHYDRDFEIVADVDARVTHQWVVPRGSVP